MNLRSFTTPPRIILALILISSFVLKLPSLGHRSIKPLDEVFHAIVARNLLSDPLLPTLNRQQYLPMDERDWQNSRIWLHKPPMALWQIAISYAVLGVNTLALRLPSAILATLAVWLTYLIGRELLDEAAALVAAAFQAFNAPIAMLVHGYVFSDHVDVAMLFWTEAAVWLLIRAIRTGATKDLVLCGVAQGLAFLTKSYPALIVSVLVMVAWLRPNRHELRKLLIVAAITLATIVPWTAVAMARFPQHLLHEHAMILRHLTHDVEQWAAPWDRLIFDFLIRVFHVYYPAVIVATLLGVAGVWCTRSLKMGLLLAWWIGVLVPHTLAVSKTMTATLIGWPAAWLLVGWMISSAVRGDGFSLGAWAGSMLAALIFIRSADIPASGWGYPDAPGFGAIMRQNIWVLWHTLAAFGAGAAMLVTMSRGGGRWIRRGAIGIASISTILLAVRCWSDDRPRGYAYLAWRVTQMHVDQVDFTTIGHFARKLPGNAVFIVDEQTKLENKLLQFWADRTCYPLKQFAWQQLARPIVEGDGLPYLVSAKPLDLPGVFVDEPTGRTVYACTPKAKSVAERAATRPADLLLLESRD